MSKSEMSKLDDMIKAALDAEDEKTFKQADELGYFQLGFSQFGGTYGWVTWLVMTIQVTMFFIGIWCAYNFFQSPETTVALKWGLSAAVMLLGGLQIKLSLAPQMQADRVIREVKRLELMVATRS